MAAVLPTRPESAAKQCLSCLGKVRYLGDQVGLKCFRVKFEDGGSMDFSTVENRNRLMPALLRKN